MGNPAPSQPEPLLVMRGISKRFGAVQALDGVDLTIESGEVHAIVGENGAGKSTLMHILAGVYQPDAGTIAFGGRPKVRIDNEQTARQLGIAIVYQERSLFPSLSIAENIFAGRQPASKCGWIRMKSMRSESLRLLAVVGLIADPRNPVESLSPAHQQLVEVAKALSLQARLIIFDEPTAALTTSETARLFEVIADLKRHGAAVVYISHRLEEVFEAADRVTVLKDGCWQATRKIQDTSPQQLISLMVGRELQLHGIRAAETERTGVVALDVDGLSDREGTGLATTLRDVTLSVRRGEIVALAGLAGAGRSETALSIFGARRFAHGTVRVHGAVLRLRNVTDAIRAGIGYVPEDRKDAGLFLEMSVAANIAVANLRHFGNYFLSDRRIEATAQSYGARLGIVCSTVRQTVLSLSGGNQQKVLLAKWLALNPRILIVDEPTRGVDVGAKAEVHTQLRELARHGTALLVISSDLPEVLALADRVVVMSEGRVTGELSQTEASEERIVQLASKGA